MGEEFILYSNDVPLVVCVYYSEGQAQCAAEQIARAHRGAKIHIAKLVASVSEPLPALQWSDERPTGNGKESGLVMGLGAAPQYAQEITAKDRYACTSCDYDRT